MVRESRAAKRMNVGSGTGRGVTGEKSLVKWLSFQRQSERFAAEVAANLVAPWVVEVAGLLWMVEEAVSIALAERYVPVYSVWRMGSVYTPRARLG